MQYKRITDLLKNRNISEYKKAKNKIIFCYNGINFKIIYDNKYYFIYNDSFYHAETYLKYNELKNILISM